MGLSTILSLSSSRPQRLQTPVNSRRHPTIDELKTHLLELDIREPWTDAEATLTPRRDTAASRETGTCSSHTDRTSLTILEPEPTEPAGNIRTTSSREQSALPSMLKTTRANSQRDSLLKESKPRRLSPKERKLSKYSNKLPNSKTVKVMMMKMNN